MIPVKKEGKLVDWYKTSRELWKNYLIKGGLSEGEATFCINRLTNNIRRYDNISDINIAINDDRIIRWHKETIELHSGKNVKIGFYAD